MKSSHLFAASLFAASSIGVHGQPITDSVFTKSSAASTAGQKNGSISIKGLEGGRATTQVGTEAKRWKINTTSQVDQILRDTFGSDAKREGGAITFRIAISNEGELKGYIGKYRTQNITGYKPASGTVGITYGINVK